MTLLALFWASLSMAAPPAEAEFVGAIKCRLCHREIFQSWRLTAHARASLSAPDMETRCITCHATAGGDLPGVQCEACHGAGGDYWPPEIMIDPEKAEMAGLVRPGPELCRRCHENAEPGHRGSFEMPAPAELAGAVHVLPTP